MSGDQFTSADDCENSGFKTAGNSLNSQITRTVTDQIQ